MLIQVLDAEGLPHWVTWQAQDQINDASGALGAPAVGPTPALQQVLAANPLRAGFLFQNTSPNAMLINELPSAEADVANSWQVEPGKTLPPCGYPIPTGIIYVVGQYSGGPVAPSSQVGDTFTCREWQNAPGE
jgi:hypothetical protein